MLVYILRLLASLATLQFAVTNALSAKALINRRNPDSSSASSSSQINATSSYQQNITTLLYPDCTPNVTAHWCGIVIGIHATDDNNTTSYYNVSITDSSCTRVGRVDGIAQNSTTNLSTSVGDWTFNIYDGSGLDMVYNGLDIGNSSVFGNDFGFEEFNVSGNSLTSVVFGDYQNCTPASKAKTKSESARVQQTLPGALAGLGLAMVSVVFMGLL